MANKKTKRKVTKTTTPTTSKVTRSNKRKSSIVKMEYPAGYEDGIIKYGKAKITKNKTKTESSVNNWATGDKSSKKSTVNNKRGVTRTKSAKSSYDFDRGEFTSKSSKKVRSTPRKTVTKTDVYDGTKRLKKKTVKRK